MSDFFITPPLPLGSRSCLKITSFQTKQQSKRKINFQLYVEVFLRGGVEGDVRRVGELVKVKDVFNDLSASVRAKSGL